MPYDRNEDLPLPVQHALPMHAQDIYRAAFNNAWHQRVGTAAFDEAVLHRIAWAAVKRQYRKMGGIWIRRESTAA